MDSQYADDRKLDFKELTRFLRTIWEHEFIRFLRTIWGAVAGISAFFPFINHLREWLPFPETRVKEASSALAMIGSALACIILFRVRYGLLRLDQPSSVRRLRGRWVQMPLAGHRSTVLGVLVLCTLAWPLYGYLRMVFGGQYIPAERAIFWYASLFILLTLGFGILGTSEYMKLVQKRDGARAYRRPLNQVARRAIWDRLPDRERPQYEHLLEVATESLRKKDELKLLTMVMKSGTATQYEVEINEDEEVLYFGPPR